MPEPLPATASSVRVVKVPLVGYSRRQCEYALERGEIRPAGRVGIIFTYCLEQLPRILEAVRPTIRRGSREPEWEGPDVSPRTE